MRQYVQHFGFLITLVFLTLVDGDQRYVTFPQRKTLETGQYRHYDYPQEYSRYEQQQLPNIYQRTTQDQNTQSITNQYPFPDDNSPQQRNQQELWRRRPIVAGYNPNPYELPTTFGNEYTRPAYPDYDPNGYTHNLQRNEINQANHRPTQPSFSNDNNYHQNQIGSPSSYDFNQMPVQRPPSLTPQDYAAHFERYVRKYPYRLQPRFV